jgi:hypothetical protein
MVCLSLTLPVINHKQKHATMKADILTIAQISVEHITDETVKYIESNFSKSWDDCHGGEDIWDIDYNLDNANDGNYDEMTESVKKNLEEIQQTVNDNKCGYFIITY